MIDWKILKELADSFKTVSTSEDHTINGDNAIATDIMANVLDILAKQGPEIIRERKDTDNPEVALVIHGKYPHEGMDTVLACWIAGFPLHIQSQLSLSPVMKRLLEGLEGLNVKVDASPVSGNTTIITELLPGKGDKRAEYLGKRKSLVRPPKRSVLFLKGEVNEDLVKAAVPYLFHFKGQAPDNIGYIVADDQSVIQSFADQSAVHQEALMHHRWMSDYDYRKSIVLLNREEHLDNGWVIFRNTDIFPPLAGTINFQVLSEVDKVTEFMMEKMVYGHNLLEDSILKNTNPAEVLLVRTAQSWVQRVFETYSFVSGGIKA